MAKYRLYFSKTGRARYISHLDLMRTFQRAFQRAEVDIRHTEGFNPHAFVSIVLPLSVGFSSQCELLEFEMELPGGEEQIPARMNGVLPEGIVVHRCYRAVRPIKELLLVNWHISLDYGARGVPDGAREAIGDLLAQESLVVSKPSKKAKSGAVELDIIPLIEHVSFGGDGAVLELNAVLSAQNPGLNPQILIRAITGALPALAPELAAFHRRDVLDRNGNPFW